MAFTYTKKLLKKGQTQADKREDSLRNQQSLLLKAKEQGLIESPNVNKPNVPLIKPQQNKPLYGPAKPFVEPNMSKVRLTPQEQAVLDKRNSALVSTKPGAFIYGTLQGAAAPARALGTLMGAPTSTQEIKYDKLAGQQISTPTMDVSRGMTKTPTIIKGRDMSYQQLGKMTGSLLPFTAVEGAVGAGLAKAAPKLTGLAQTVTRGALSGSAIQGVESASQGKSPTEVAKDVAIGAILGAGVDIGLGVLGKAIGKVKTGQPLSQVEKQAIQTQYKLNDVNDVDDVVRSIETELGLPKGTTAQDFVRQQEQVAREIESENYLQGIESNKGKFKVKGNLKPQQQTVRIVKYGDVYYNITGKNSDGTLQATNVFTKQQTKIPKMFESELEEVTREELKQKTAKELNKGIQNTSYAETVQRIKNTNGDYVDSKPRTYRQYDDEESQFIVDELNKLKGGDGYSIQQVKNAFNSIANGKKLNTELHNAIDRIIESKIYKNEIEQPKLKQPDSVQSIAENTGLEQQKPLTSTLTKAEVKTELNAFKEPIIDKGMKERGLGKNIRTDKNMPDVAREQFSEEPLQYKQLGNETTLQAAEREFAKGIESATNTYNANRNLFKPENVPLAKLIAKEHYKTGNIQAGREILSDVAEELTRAGQFGQAARILRESGDPVVLQMTMEKQIKKLNKDGLELYGDKWKPVGLTDDEIKLLANKENLTDDEVETIMNQIGDRIAKEMPVTNLEKFNTWRRMAMLMNPRTHVRNTVGNALMKTLDSAKDTIALGIESAAEKAGKITKEQRTKSIGWKKDPELVKTVEDSWKTVKPDLTNEGKYDVFSLKALGREKPTFKTKWLENLNQISKQSLEAEDVFFLKGAYKQALGSFMKARGLKEPTEEAIKYASNYAQEATFRQASEFANFINGLKKKKGYGTLVEAAVPFTKTPINILKRSIEYTPYSLSKALFKKGQEPAKVIDDLSKGLTGSGLISLGWMLAANGWARGDYSKSKGAEGLLQAAGEQPNSIITPQGSYTFDWAQPVSVPIAMGIAAFEGARDKDAPIDAITSAVAKGGDTLVNQSMLKNIKELFGGYGTMTEKVMGLPVSYLEQAFPTLVGQVARTVDTTRRESYAPTKSEQQIRRMQAKVPGASKKLEPKIDIWGNEIKSEQPVGNAVQQFLSPGFAKEKSKDVVTNDLLALYKEKKLPELLPKVAPKSFTSKGVEYKFTPTEYTDVQKRLGQLNYNSYQRIIPQLKVMTDEQIIKAIKKIKDDNWDTVRGQYIQTKR